MNTKIAAIAGFVALGAVALLGAGPAQATVTKTRAALGNSFLIDVGVAGGGALKSTLTLNASGSISDITTATSGVYSNRLKTTCPDGSIQDNLINTTGTLFGDLVHLCSFGLERPTTVTATINDI